MNLEMKVGDVINVKGKSPISLLIRLFTQSKYSHTACYVGDSQCIESSWGGVQLRNIDDYKNYDIFRHKSATKEQLEISTQWMISQIGSKYDYLGLLGIAKSIILKDKDNELDDKNRYWCSELVADGYHKSFITTDMCLFTCMTSPEDFAKSKWFYKVEK